MQRVTEESPDVPFIVLQCSIYLTLCIDKYFSPWVSEGWEFQPISLQEHGDAWLSSLMRRMSSVMTEDHSRGWRIQQQTGVSLLHSIGPKEGNCFWCQWYCPLGSLPVCQKLCRHIGPDIFLNEYNPETLSSTEPLGFERILFQQLSL